MCVFMEQKNPDNNMRVFVVWMPILSHCQFSLSLSLSLSLSVHIIINLKYLFVFRDLSPSCGSFAVPSLCYSTFPLCREEDTDPTGLSENWSKVASREPRRICRDDCEILENERCRMEYALAKKHPLIGQRLTLLECRDLPAIGTADSENCLKLGIPKPENVEPGRHSICVVF